MKKVKKNADNDYDPVLEMIRVKEKIAKAAGYDPKRLMEMVAEGTKDFFNKTSNSIQKKKARSPVAKRRKTAV